MNSKREWDMTYICPSNAHTPVTGSVHTHCIRRQDWAHGTTGQLHTREDLQLDFATPLLHFMVMFLCCCLLACNLRKSASQCVASRDPTLAGSTRFSQPDVFRRSRIVLHPLQMSVATQHCTSAGHGRKQAESAIQAAAAALLRAAMNNHHVDDPDAEPSDRCSQRGECCLPVSLVDDPMRYTCVLGVSAAASQSCECKRPSCAARSTPSAAAAGASSVSVDISASEPSSSATAASKSKV
jgi:hypothetical protein